LKSFIIGGNLVVGYTEDINIEGYARDLDLTYKQQ
jgi:hypothetical protein